MRAVLADPDRHARGDLRAVLERDAGFAIAAEVDNGDEAVGLALHYRPDVVVLEASMPRLGGVEATRRITQAAEDVRTVLYAASADADLQLAALRAGASGFIVKGTDHAALVRAIRGVMAGQAAVSRMVERRLVEGLRARPEAGGGMRPVNSPLTSREWEVLDLVAAGASPEEAAAHLGVTESTISSHLKHVMRKLDVDSVPGALEAVQAMFRPEAAGP